MKVVSLFDGMGCGLEALKRAGISVSEYHAFEIDKYAIKIAKKNHPEIIHHGEINFMTDFSYLKGADLLMGGSPCQGFSMSGKGLAFKDKRSQLFFEFLRAKKEIKPRYFLLENVRMNIEINKAIDKLIKKKSILINSALVSAQKRDRLYWCNWKVSQPEDKNIFLKDIIEHGVVDREKSYCIDAHYFKGGDNKSYFERGRRQLVFDISQTPFILSQRGRHIVDGRRKDYKDAPTEQRLEVNYSGKSNCLTSVQKDNLLADGVALRKLTPIECERLQTLPDNYTEGVSKTQRYKMLGNGWTVDVITHLLKGIKI